MAIKILIKYKISVERGDNLKIYINIIIDFIIKSKQKQKFFLMKKI